MAGYLKSIGFPQLTFGPMTVDYGPKGNTTHFEVTCTTLAPLIAYYNSIVQYGATGTFHGLDVGLDGVTSSFEKKLTVSVPGIPNNLSGIISELYFDQWELLSNEGSDTVFADPLLMGGAMPVINYNAKVILSYVQQHGGTIQQAVAACNQNINYSWPGLPSSDPFAGYTDGILQPPDGALGGKLVEAGDTGDFWYQFTLDTFTPAQIQLALEFAKGQTEYESPQYVLRHTSYCSPGSVYGVSVADLNTETIYSTAQLLSECGTGWTYNLPARLYTRVSAAGAAVQFAAPEEAPFYTWGWLKRMTREPQLSNFMIEVNCEYVLALWSNLRYAVL